MTFDISLQARADGNRKKRMDDMDQMPAEIRHLIHEYGFTSVNAFLQCGVTKPARIRHLIVTVIQETSPIQGAYSKQGKRTEVHDRL